MGRRKAGLQRKTTTTKEATAEVLVSLVELERIVIDDELQSRVEIDDQTVHDYTMRMTKKPDEPAYDPEGRMWEPLELYIDEGTLYLADGFHRYRAAKRKGYVTFQANIRSGSRQDAFEASLGANARHGKRRTRADKRRAVKRALLNETVARMSNRDIARMCAVSHPMVGEIRKELEEEGNIEVITERVGADNRRINTANIGTGKKYQSPTPIGDIEGVSVRKPSIPDEYPVNPHPDIEVTSESFWRREIKFVPATNLTRWSKLAETATAFNVYITPKPTPPQVIDACFGMANTPAGSLLCRAYVATEEQTELWVWGGEHVPEFNVPAHARDHQHLVEMISELLGEGA